MAENALMLSFYMFSIDLWCKRKSLLTSNYFYLRSQPCRKPTMTYVSKERPLRFPTSLWSTQMKLFRWPHFQTGMHSSLVLRRYYLGFFFFFFGVFFIKQQNKHAVRWEWLQKSNKICVFKDEGSVGLLYKQSILLCLLWLIPTVRLDSVMSYSLSHSQTLTLW